MFECVVVAFGENREVGGKRVCRELREALVGRRVPGPHLSKVADRFGGVGDSADLDSSGSDLRSNNEKVSRSHFING